MAAAALAAWCAGWLDLGRPWSTAGVLIAAAAAFISGWRLLPQHAGVLQWTGGAWTWQASGSTHVQVLGDVSLAIDLSSNVLLRLSLAPTRGWAWPRRSLWVTAQRGQDPAAWPGFCALLHDPAASPRNAAPEA